MPFLEFAAVPEGIDNEQEEEDRASDEEDHDAGFAVPEVAKKVGEIRVHRWNLHHVGGKTKKGWQKVMD